MIELSGLWLHESKDGMKYFSGSLGRARLVVFKNNFKKEEKEPDYILYLDEPIKKEKVASDAIPMDDIPF